MCVIWRTEEGWEVLGGVDIAIADARRNLGF